MKIFRLANPPSYCYKEKAADTLRQPLSCITREMVAGVFESQERGEKDFTVCFTGHRVIPKTDKQNLAARLDDLLLALYDRGYRRFISGMAVGFDVMAAEAVIRLKVQHADVQLVMAIPCYEQWGRWTEQDCQRYERIIYHTDHVHVLSPKYYEGCMLTRNRFMVDRSALCLCYLTHHRGGTMATVAYAMQNDCPVLNLAIQADCEAFIRGT